MLRAIKLLSLFLSVILLSQCTNVTALPAQQSFAQLPSAKLTSPYTLPAIAYIERAKNQIDSEQQASMLMAAGRLVQDDQWREALTILSQLNDLPAELTNQKQILLAKIDLIKEHPHAAITHLSAVRQSEDVSLYEQVQFHDILAHAYQTMGNTLESVNERIKLEKLLPDEVAKAHNRNVLWISLTTLSMAELNTLAAEAGGNSELEGWMQLALISRKKYQTPQALLAKVTQWQLHYPQHPGHTILPPTLESVNQHLINPPKQIALLLPLTGPLAGPGNAIKDGFMEANTHHSAKIHLYDTNSKNVVSLYQQAISEGADYVVGPLSKNNVATIAAIEHPVPTLLLNDVDVSIQEKAYQFSLSPNNEAKQVAIHARNHGYSRALVIAPSGSWGNGVVNIFAEQWRNSGGRIIDTLHYQSNDDMSAVIRDFLRITDSETRQQQLKRLLGHQIEAIPSRRQDFDVIFLLAYPSKARQIMPLLKYYYAGDMPVYATSTVYAGTPNAMRDRDLNGIIFCDMPWVFNHQSGHKNWPEQFNSYNRLYALGRDSYALTTQLNQLHLFPAMKMSNKNGVLLMNTSQQIARVMGWGQFKEGMVENVKAVVL